MATVLVLPGNDLSLYKVYIELNVTQFSRFSWKNPCKKKKVPKIVLTNKKNPEHIQKYCGEKTISKPFEPF